MEYYDQAKHGSLESFVEGNYLNDIDLFTPYNYQLHLSKGVPMAFLAFEKRLNLQKDQELLNFLILKLAVRVREHYQDRLQFAIIQLDDFPSLKMRLRLEKNSRGLQYLINDFQNKELHLLTKSFVEENDNIIDSKVLLEFTTDVVFKRVKPFRLSQENLQGFFNEHGVRLFNTRSLESYFYNKQYLEQESVILFHNDDEEADEVFQAFDEIASELRKRNVFKLVVSKINMNLNEPCDLFPIYQYPSVHIIFKTQDGEMGAQQILANNKKNLFHQIYTYS